MQVEQILSLIGLSSIISIIVTFIFDHIKTRLNLKYEKLFSEKENRYRSMLVFMSVVVDEKNFLHINTEYKPGSENKKDYYLREVTLHKNFFYLFAEEYVISAVEEFIKSPNDTSFQNVAQAMRKDLWGKKKRNYKDSSETKSSILPSKKTIF